MPWQRRVLDVGLELDPRTGRLAYREVTLTVPRQQGKSTALLVLILLRALHEPRQRIRYTAQTGSDARKKWLNDWLPLLEHSKFARLFTATRQNGHEGLRFYNGSLQGLLATAKESGHGESVDLAILDEVFSQKDSRLEQAMRPASITRKQPQLWVVSTAGTPNDSPYLWSKVEKGRLAVEGGVTEGAGYFEWAAADELDPADEETWWACMPALGRTVPIEAIRADYQQLVAEGKLGEFERAYLNRWKTVLTDPAIPLTLWKDAGDPESEPVDPLCFAFDVTPSRDAASIAVGARRADGIWHIELIANKPGVDWVVPRIAELVEEHNPAMVACDPYWSASLLPDFGKRGVDVTLISSTDHALACAYLFDAVIQRTVRHREQPQLLAALDGATKRGMRDNAWCWDRKNSNVDISPLVASTLALWAAAQDTQQYATVLIPGEHQAAAEAEEWVGPKPPRVLTQDETTTCFACRTGGCTIHGGQE